MHEHDAAVRHNHSWKLNNMFRLDTQWISFYRTNFCLRPWSSVFLKPQPSCEPLRPSLPLQCLIHALALLRPSRPLYGLPLFAPISSFLVLPGMSCCPNASSWIRWNSCPFPFPWTCKHHHENAAAIVSFPFVLPTLFWLTRRILLFRFL